MIIVVTGIPGVGKTTVLNELQNQANKDGVKLAIVNFGTVMNELLKHYGGEMNRDHMRKQSVELQKRIQSEAARKIAGMAADAVLIVDTHMFIRTSTGYLAGLPIHVLSELKPNLLVLVEAPPKEIARRRASDETRSRESRPLSDVEFDISWSRATASSCAVLSGAPVKIVQNEKGKQGKAAEELLTVIKHMGK